MSESNVTRPLGSKATEFVRRAALLGLALCSIWLVGCSDENAVNYHISNSEAFPILVTVNGEAIATVQPQTSVDVVHNAGTTSDIDVLVYDASTLAIIGGENDLSVNASTEEIDISALNGQVFISVNPQRSAAAADTKEAADAPSEPTVEDLLQDVTRAVRALWRP